MSAVPQKYSAPTEAVGETMYPSGVEAVEALSYGLRTAPGILGNLGDTRALPTREDDAGSKDPVARGVRLPASFLRIFCSWSSSSGAQAHSSFGMISSFSRAEVAARLRIFVFKERSTTFPFRAR